MTNIPQQSEGWQDEWPAKGLLQECRRLWVERDRLRARIAELESQIAAGPTWVTQSGVQWRLDQSTPEEIAKIRREIR